MKTTSAEETFRNVCRWLGARKLALIAIVVIGVVGLLLEQLLVALAKAFTYEQVNT